MNNRTLVIVFISCLAIFFGSRLLRKDRSSSFDPVLLNLDTAVIDRITFKAAAADKKDFELKKVSGIWHAISGQADIEAKASSVRAILSPAASLEAQRVMTDRSDMHEQYQVSDAEATHITFWSGNKKEGEIIAGGFKFDPATRSAAGYVRRPGSSTVYLIDGFTAISLNPQFDQFRDRRLIRGNTEDLTSIEYADSFGNKKVIQKLDGQWHYAGIEAIDSASFQSYLTGLVNVQGSSFSDLTSTQGLQLIEKLSVQGNNMSPTVISAYDLTDTIPGNYILHSTANPDALFVSDSSGIYGQIFIDLRQFWPHGQ